MRRTTTRRLLCLPVRRRETETSPRLLVVAPVRAVLLANRATASPRLPLAGRLMHPLLVNVSYAPIYTDGINVAKQAPNPSNVLGVFGLSIRTTERDLEDEFARFGQVDKVTIVYDQRVCAPLDPCICPVSLNAVPV